MSVLLILGATASLATALASGVLPHHPNSAVIEMTRRASRLPPAIGWMFGIGCGLVEGLAGVLLLRRREVGRSLYAVVGGCALLFGLLNARLVTFVVLQAVIYAVYMLLLFRPIATKWFRYERA